jgi:hypothetical protein
VKAYWEVEVHYYYYYYGMIAIFQAPAPSGGIAPFILNVDT